MAKPLQEVREVKKGEAVIYGALVSAINELQNPKNSMDNLYFKSKYVPLADILDTAKPVLAKHGLAVLQVPHVLYEVVQKQGNGRNGEIFHYNEEVGVVKMTTSIIHVSGAKLDFPPMIFKAGGNTPQNIGSAITYARRYSISSILGIAGKEEDDDGNYASQPQQYQQRGNYQQPPQQGYQQQGYQQTPMLNNDQLIQINSIINQVSTLTGKGADALRNSLTNGVPIEQVPQTQFQEVLSTVNKWLDIASKKAEEKKRQESDVAEAPKTEKEEEEVPKQEKNPVEEAPQEETKEPMGEPIYAGEFTLKSSRKGTSPNGTPFIEVIVENSDDKLMIKDVESVAKVGKLKKGDKFFGEIVELNGFKFIESVQI